MEKTLLACVLLLSSISSQAFSEMPATDNTFPQPCEVKCMDTISKIDTYPEGLYILKNNQWISYYLVSTSVDLPEIRLGSNASVEVKNGQTYIAVNDFSDLPEELRKMFSSTKMVYQWVHLENYKVQECNIVSYSINHNGKIESQSLENFQDPGVKLAIKKIKVIDQNNKTGTFEVASNYEYPSPTAKLNSRARLLELRKIGVCTSEH